MRFFVAGLPLLASANRIKVDPDSGNFVDAQGNVRIFHGINAVYKGFPWHPTTGEFDAENSLNALDMQNLQKWGFNAVRLGVMWHGVEPEEGKFNSTYLTVMRKMVDDLHDHGIYTIVDFHQDVIAQKWCGEGIPSWVADKVQNVRTNCAGFVPTVAGLVGQCIPFSTYQLDNDKDTGFPNKAECLSPPGIKPGSDFDFTQFSQSPEVFSTWGAFYDQEDIQQAFQSFWRQVAKSFAGSSGVLGYDLINEPNPGDFSEDATLLLPHNTDKKKLQPMYKALSKIILSEDPEAVIMYEPAPFPATVPAGIPLLEGVHEVGFTEGPADASHQALSYHIYSCGFADTKCTPEGVTKTMDCPKCDKFAADAVKIRQEDIQRLGGAVFLTEFGSCPDQEECYVEIDRVTSQADTAFHSWAYWQFKYFQDITSISGSVESFYTDKGELQQKKVAALSRTYAPKISGVPQQVRYERTTGAFRLKYLSDGGSSEIFINEEMNYQSGHDVHATNAVVTKSGVNRLEVQADSGAAVDVVILPSTSANGVASGFIYSADKDTLRWSVEDSETPGFELTVASNMTTGYYHGLVIKNDDGVQVCSFGMEHENHGPEGCNLEAASQNSFLFSYKIELWKAKVFGIHEHVDDVGVEVFGPLYGKRVVFTWVDDNPPFVVEADTLLV